MASRMNLGTVEARCWICLFLSIFFQPCLQAGFDVEPDAASGIVPIGQQAIFHCRASEGFLISKWEVTLPGGLRTLSTNVDNHAGLLHMLGIDFNIEMSMRESNLTINTTNATSGSIVQCEVEEINNRLNAPKSPPVQTVFYGPPPPPTDLTTGELSNGRLHLMWNFSFIPSVEVWFTLTILKNNSYSQQETKTVVQNITENKATIDIDYSFCDVYYFGVMAENNAGQGDPSADTKWIPPYQPNFTAPSLQHSLAKTEEGVIVTVTVNVPIECPEYSAAIFDVVLNNQTGIDRSWRQSGLQRMQEQLQEDQIYFIKIESNGQPLTASKKIVTSDVQDVEVCLRDKSFIIRCTYVTGSTISGCGYTLVRKGSVAANISGKILRNSGGMEQIKVNETTDFEQVIVYDLPNGGNQSNVGTSITKSLQGLNNCPATDYNSGGTSQSSNSPTVTTTAATTVRRLPLLTVILPVALLGTVIIFVIVVTSIVYMCCHKGTSVELKKHDRQKNGHIAGGGQRSKVQSRYSQSARVADKDCEDQYDLLSNMPSVRDSITTRTSTSTRGSFTRTSFPNTRESMNVRCSSAMFDTGIDNKQASQVFYDEGDYSQLNMGPVYQVLEADNGSVSPATPPQAVTAPPGANRGVTPSSNRPTSVQVRSLNPVEDDYAHIDEEPVYHVLENDHRPSRPERPPPSTTSRNEFTPSSSIPPALPSRSPSRERSHRIHYTDVQTS